MQTPLSRMQIPLDVDPLPSACWEANPHPTPVNRQTDVKTLPSQTSFAGGNDLHHSYLSISMTMIELSA